MTDHAARAHSPYGASAAHRWFVCPGSVKRCLSAPPRSSAYAEEGTRAHELLEATLRVLLSGNDGAAIAEYQALVEAYPAIELKAAHDAVGVHVERVEFILDAYPDAVVLLEHRFNIPSQYAPEPVFGTNDVCLYVPSLQTLFVDDYKHGAGVAVEVEEKGVANLQLMSYGVGALFSFPEWDIKRVELTIVQPRCFHPHGAVRSVVVEPADLIEFAGQFDEKILDTLNDDAPLVPSEKGCRWCDAKPGCPAVQAQALRVLGQSDIRNVNVTTLPNQRLLGVDQLAYILQAKKLVLDWFGDVADYAEELARTGHHIPGYKLVNTQRRRKWFGDEEAIAQHLIALADFELSLDDVYPRTLIAITEASEKIKTIAKANAPRGKKTMAAKAVEESMAFLTVKDTSGNVVLVSETDKRPAISIGSEFGEVNLPEIKMIE